MERQCNYHDLVGWHLVSRNSGTIMGKVTGYDGERLELDSGKGSITWEVEGLCHVYRTMAIVPVEDVGLRLAG
jgi:hypothetical protein